MWKYDGWDSNFRLGVVTPHADIGPEAEMQAMLEGTRATVHGARVDFSPMHPGGLMDDKIAHEPVLKFIDPELLGPTVSSLSSSPLDAIALSFTSSSFKIGPARESTLLKELQEYSHGVKLFTTASAATAAIEHLGITRLAVMAPSWFDEDLCRDGERYFREQNVDVLSVTASGPTGGPLAITPAATAKAVERLVTTEKAQGVFIAGNGQRAIGSIDHLEQSLGVPVLTANQVLLWAALESSSIRKKISGYGRLFSL